LGVCDHNGSGGKIRDMKNIKEIKKHLGIGNRDIADAFGYSNETGYNNGKNGKVRLERGLEWFFSIVERGQKEKKKGSNTFD